MPVMITVRGTRADSRVCLNEQHADHPGGAAWVCGDGRAHHVALTREVARRIGDGSLDVVELVAVPGIVEEGGAPLELGEQLGGFLPPAGDETSLPFEQAPAPDARAGRRKGGS